MGTEVLRPYDCLTQPIGLSPAVFHRRKTYGNGKTVIRSERPEQIKRSPVQRRRPAEPLTKSKRSASADDLRYNNNNTDNLVHGKVTILRRGESLSSITEANEKKNVTDEMPIYGTGRLGPDPETVMKQVRVGLPDVYAGSAASMSPSPRALPLPSFFKKVDKEECVDDSATKDLRRLLRLD